MTDEESRYFCLELAINMYGKAPEQWTWYWLLLWESWEDLCYD